LVGPIIPRSVIGDIRDYSLVASTFQEVQPEIVIHMAAQALVHPSYDDPVGTFDTNVMGLVRVLDAARTTASVRAVVNVTSDKCYENREQLWAYRETEPMGGADPYSASKGCAELITSSYRRSFFNKEEGPWLGSGRAGNVVGGGDWAPNRLVPDCIRAFQDGEPVRIRNPQSTRPWQHVLEPVCGYLMLAQALYERGAEVAEGWNFGPPDEDAWPVQNVVRKLAEAWGAAAAWQVDRCTHNDEAKLLRVDATKAKVRLGWAPRLKVDEALEWSVEWNKLRDSGRPALEICLDQIQRFAAIKPTGFQSA